jgi:hypothetical protein
VPRIVGVEKHQVSSASHLISSHPIPSHLISSYFIPLHPTSIPLHPITTDPISSPPSLPRPQVLQVEVVGGSWSAASERGRRRGLSTVLSRHWASSAHAALVTPLHLVPHATFRAPMTLASTITKPVPPRKAGRSCRAEPIVRPWPQVNMGSPSLVHQLTWLLNFRLRRRTYTPSFLTGASAKAAPPPDQQLMRHARLVGRWPVAPADFDSVIEHKTFHEAADRDVWTSRIRTHPLRPLPTWIHTHSVPTH